MGTAIEWTDATWNPTTGCTKVSPGCAHCYIERTPPFRIAGRRFISGRIPLRLHFDRIEHPLHWRKPRHVFVNSMSDLFHEQTPECVIRDVFETIVQADWHKYQILTKRSERLQALAPSLPWPPHIWQGVSVENVRFLHRIDDLRAVPAAIRFLSLEPLLSPLPDLNLDGIGWVIVGGESGPGARPMRAEWVREIRDQCIAGNVPFFFKQWGGRTPKARGRTLDGRTWDEMPEARANAS